LTAKGCDGAPRATEIELGRVRCQEFPIVLMTSNDEREFPPAFLRRCLELDIQPPEKPALTRIVEAHLGLRADPTLAERIGRIVESFLTARAQSNGSLATDQLLHAVFLALRNVDVEQRLASRDCAPWNKDELIRRLWRPVQ
jgi:MoxR-like ATPase